MSSYYKRRGYIVRTDTTGGGSATVTSADAAAADASTAHVDAWIDEQEAEGALWLWGDAWSAPPMSVTPPGDANAQSQVMAAQTHVRVCSSALVSPRSTQGVYVVKRPMYGRECDPNFFDHFVLVHSV